MTRDQLIDRVLTKLDEKSPFDEPQSFIAAEGDSSYDKVKPIKVYVDDLLDEAANDCLRMLPLSLVRNDIEHKVIPNAKQIKGVVSIGFNEVHNRFAARHNYVRFVRVSSTLWNRNVTSFITSSSPLYELQQNIHTRGKSSKPVVVIVPEKESLELYSFNSALEYVHVEFYFIDCDKTAGSNSNYPVKSPIEDFIAIRCAELVCNVFGSQTASVFQKEFTEKVNSVLK